MKLFTVLCSVSKQGAWERKGDAVPHSIHKVQRLKPNLHGLTGGSCPALLLTATSLYIPYSVSVVISLGRVFPTKRKTNKTNQNRTEWGPKELAHNKLKENK